MPTPTISQLFRFDVNGRNGVVADIDGKDYILYEDPSVDDRFEDLTDGDLERLLAEKYRAQQATPIAPIS